MNVSKMEIYGNHHRAFLQSLMWIKIAKAAEIKKIFMDSCDQYKVEVNRDNMLPELSIFIRTINEKIRDFHMEIKKGVDELNDTNYYGLVNLSHSSTSLTSSDYTPNELELFKKIIEAIVESESRTLSSISALHLADELDKHMAKKDAEELLERLVKDMWLIEEQGVLSLSTRCIIELERYLLSTYEAEILLCSLCQKIVLRGKTCSNCNLRLHMYCLEKVFRRNKTFHCPSCKEVWPPQ